MKRNLIFLVAAAFTLLLSVSCDRTVEYEFNPYATLYTTSYTVDENVGELKIPVAIYNPTGSEVQVSVKLLEGLAEEGVDYELISPASGILSFSGETDSLDVVLGIKSFEGEFTGTKNFALEISSLTAGLTVGNIKTANVTINDLDHPLAPFFGVWSAVTYEEVYLETDVTLTFDIAADPNDVTKVVASIVDPMMSAVVGYTKPVVLSGNATLNDDGTGVLVIPNAQATGFEYSYGPWLYMGLDAKDFGSASEYTDIVMNLNADGTITVPNAFGIFDDSYIWASYVGGYTLTKK